jgi:hypothetical protein
MNYLIDLNDKSIRFESHPNVYEMKLKESQWNFIGIFFLICNSIYFHCEFVSGTHWTCNIIFSICVSFSPRSM